MDDFPAPLCPVSSSDVPFSIAKLRSRTRSEPSGVRTSTWSNAMRSPATITSPSISETSLSSAESSWCTLVAGPAMRVSWFNIFAVAPAAIMLSTKSTNWWPMSPRSFAMFATVVRSGFTFCR
eukprot:gene8490-biopygen8473